MQLFRSALIALLVGVATPVIVCADDLAPPSTIQFSPTANADYETTISKRADDIVALLEFKTDEQKAAVHKTIVTQYRTLNAWHDANDARREELRKVVGRSFDPTPEKLELDKINASLNAIHNWYLTELGTQLTAEQILAVKDKMTYFKVKVTYHAYLNQQPNLTEEHKAFLYEELVLAREAAMDAGTSKEKDTIFDKFKGRMNNWLVKNGYELGGKKPTTKPSTQSAK